MVLSSSVKINLNPPAPDIVLVDDADQPIGVTSKEHAHQAGLLHRAFSVFVVRRGVFFEMLLQQRHWGKYHCGGLWTNTCCSHPKPNEPVKQAAQRRLQEEMGLVVDLTPIGSFQYRAVFDNGLIENELDHVFLGCLPDFNDNTEGPIINPHPDEVVAYRWIDLSTLEAELHQYPHAFTPWFLPALHLMLSTPQFRL